MTKIQTFKKAGIHDVIGSSFTGYLEASYADLVREFGQPHWRNQEGPWRSGDSKVRCEWAFKIGTGKHKLVFTIYDYKEVKPVEEITLWHVGAKGYTPRLGRIFKTKSNSEVGLPPISTNGA